MTKIHANPIDKQQLEIQRLISLKKHEKPNSLTQTRIFNQINASIDALEKGDQAESIGGRINVFAVLRYGLATLCVIFLVTHFMFLSDLPQIKPISWGNDYPVETTVTVQKPDKIETPILMQTASNKSPNGIQYGTESELVGFEF